MLNKKATMANPDIAYWTIQYYDRYLDTLDEFIEYQEEEKKNDSWSRSFLDVIFKIKKEGKL